MISMRKIQKFRALTYVNLVYVLNFFFLPLSLFLTVLTLKLIKGLGVEQCALILPTLTSEYTGDCYYFFLLVISCWLLLFCNLIFNSINKNPGGLKNNHYISRSK